MIKNKIIREVHDEMLKETRRLQAEQDEKYEQFASRNKRAFEDAESSRDFIIEHFDKSLKNVADTLSLSLNSVKEDVGEIKEEIKKHSDSIESINKDKIRMEDDIKHLNEKIDKQEEKNDKTKWWVLGIGAVIIGYIIQHLLAIPGLF